MFSFFLSIVFGLFFAVSVVQAEPQNVDSVFQAIQGEISGNRARDYTMRLWLCDKWSTLPGWKKSVEEARNIMQERGFDEAKIDETPADGKTMSGAWTNPIGWDVKQATLEVIEPVLPDEYRYLCNYLDNPTSLNTWSAQTPPEGIETELVLWEGSDPKELAGLNAKGKIVLTYGGTRGLKRYMDPNGIPGFLGDYIETQNKDFINANQWLNGWSDLPGGWWMTSYDSKNNFGFSISQKKANYLRAMLRQGKKIKVRAKIDSRYYTDDTLTYVTGLIKGSGSDSEEILITGHLNEWGAGDNAAGVSSILESAGVLNDLIKSGKLPRPKRSIRVLLGAEMYGSLPYVQKYLERLQTKTIAAICCDTGAENYDQISTKFNIYMNPNVCPTFTDALYPEIARKYLQRYSPYRTVVTMPYSMGTDTYFCEPMIGVPTNWIYLTEAGNLHHNSMDTIDKVDPRTLRELSFINAAYLYYIANAGIGDVRWISELTFSRGMQVIVEKAPKANRAVLDATDGSSIGKALADGIESINYYTSLQKQALTNIEKLTSGQDKNKAREIFSPYMKSLDEAGASLIKQLQTIAETKAKEMSCKIVKANKVDSAWEKEAATIIPKRNHFATLFLAEIPFSEWKEISASPHWWEATDWAAASFWWVDGKRNLSEIKRLCEIEAEHPVNNFDLINYYKFLKKFNYVEFVDKK